MSKQPKREIRYLSVNKNEFFGTVGAKTSMTYRNGSVAHIGDLVGIYYNGKFQSESLIGKERNSPPYIMGLKSYYNITNGKSNCEDFSIELITKYNKLKDGKYRDGLLEVVTLENDPHLVAPSKKITEQKKKSFPITVQIKADLLFDRPVIEDTNGEDVFIFSGRSVFYVNKLLGEFGISTCNSNELKSYSKEIGKALAYYRCIEKVKSSYNQAIN